MQEEKFVKIRIQNVRHSFTYCFLSNFIFKKRKQDSSYLLVETFKKLITKSFSMHEILKISMLVAYI